MNPAHEEFLLWQNYYARKYELQKMLDDDDAKQSKMVCPVKEIISNDLIVVNNSAKLLLKKRFDSLRIGPQFKIKNEAEILMDTLTLCLNWVSQLTNQRELHCNPNHLPLKYKFPMNINDSQLFNPWNYLHKILVSEYNAISIIFNNMNMEYVWCCDAEEYLSAVTVAQHNFANVLMEFQSIACTGIMQINRKNLLTAKDEVIQLTEFLKKLILIIRKVGTYLWASKIVIKKVKKNKLKNATALLPFQDLAPKDKNHGA